MFVRPGRRLAAGIVAALACAAAAPPPSPAAGGSYTQILCVDPETGRPAVSDSQLPDGMTNPGHYPVMTGASTLARCSSGGGIPVGTNADTRSPNTGAALVYRADDESVRFRGASLYRQYLDSGRWSLFVHRASDWASPYASPWVERCDGTTCSSLGNGTPFSAENRLTFSAGTESTNGFSLAVLCEIPDSTWACGADPSRGLRLFGGRVTLEDIAAPQMSGSASGSLIEETVLAGPAEVTVNATDAGAGLYRVRVLLDNVVRLTQIVDPNGGHCVDAAPMNGDPYEFVDRRPCRRSAGGTYSFDTRELPDGRFNLKVQVEDAGGNATTVVNHAVVVDNVPPPTVIDAPALSGVARRSGALAVSPATWDTHGAGSALTTARFWQRCLRDGSSCVDVPGATGSTYELTTADLNRRVRVVETASNGEGSSSAASLLSAVVTREDGTLPADNDGVDNDGDGQVDEPGETGSSGSGSGSTASPSGSGSTASPSSGGSSALRPSAPTSERVASLDGAANGQGASARAVLTVRWSGATKPSRIVPFGRSSVVEGRLADEEGRPIRDAIVDVASVVATRGARPASLQAAVTGADGSFRYAVAGRSATRSLTFAYRHLRGGAVTSSATLALRVRAGVKLAVRLRGTAVRYSGRVLAASLPKTGKLVVVQGRAKGGRWQTFASRRAKTKKGTFSGRYRLKVRRPGTRLQFRVRVVGESGWPYAAATSKVVTRTVR